MTSDYEKMRERLVKNLSLIDDHKEAVAYGWYAQTCLAICAVDERLAVFNKDIEVKDEYVRSIYECTKCPKGTPLYITNKGLFCHVCQRLTSPDNQSVSESDTTVSEKGTEDHDCHSGCPCMDETDGDCKEHLFEWRDTYGQNPDDPKVPMHFESYKICVKCNTRAEGMTND